MICATYNFPKQHSPVCKEIVFIPISQFLICDHCPSSLLHLKHCMYLNQIPNLFACVFAQLNPLWTVGTFLYRFKPIKMYFIRLGNKSKWVDSWSAPTQSSSFKAFFLTTVIFFLNLRGLGLGTRRLPSTAPTCQIGGLGGGGGYKKVKSCNATFVTFGI